MKPSADTWKARLLSILLNNPAGRGGFLYLDDIRSMQFPRADLVILSACETLRGPVQGGDNMLAFNSAFLKGGAPSVVASLWKVDDGPTQYLMAEFYRQLLEGASKARALRLAELATRKRYPDPHDWAAFELTGDPGPIQASSLASAIVARTLLIAGMISCMHKSSCGAMVTALTSISATSH